LAKDKPENQSDLDDEKVVDNNIEEHFSVSTVIDNFLHRVLDIEDCAKEFISTARKNYRDNAKRLNSELTEYQNILDIEEDPDKRLIGVRKIRKCVREIDRHIKSAPMEVLEKSLFISLFAAFDKYIGDLIAVLYNKNPELYKNINREMPLSEILSYESIDAIREVILDKEIETIRRKGYMDQFSELEKKFSIKLTKFDNWPEFIERTQRRNLFTHCDGIVSKQYLDVCKSVGFNFEREPEIGDQLKIGSKYFFGSCYLITEVAVMLGQTLWRKTTPKDIKECDQNLNLLIFDFLHMEAWGKAISLSKFALNLPDISNDQMERMFSVNYAIALKAINKGNAAKNVLDKKDWSATSYDFRLAYSVLCEDYEVAGKLMNKVGKEGELISEIAYHDWPLFREFRDRVEFFENYESVYGYKYSLKLSSIAEEKKAEVSESQDI